LTSKDPVQTEISKLRGQIGAGTIPGNRCVENPVGYDRTAPSSAKKTAGTLGKMVGGCNE
jgi:hypothetical protein